MVSAVVVTVANSHTDGSKIEKHVNHLPSWLEIVFIGSKSIPISLIVPEIINHDKLVDVCILSQTGDGI